MPISNESEDFAKQQWKVPQPESETDMYMYI